MRLSTAQIRAREQVRRHVEVARAEAADVGERVRHLGAVVVEREAQAREARGDELVEVALAQEQHAVRAHRHLREALLPRVAHERRESGAAWIAADELDARRAPAAARREQAFAAPAITFSRCWRL